MSSEAKATIEPSVEERLHQVRELMKEEKIDALFVGTGDAHNSEYVSEMDKRRVWISGFTGSAGTAVITLKHALLWTDSRYFNQAAQQLTSQWTLMKQGTTGVPTIEKWLTEHLENNQRVGIDPEVTSMAQYFNMQTQFSNKNDDNKTIEIVLLSRNLVDVVWDRAGTRPSNSGGKIFIHDEIKYAGESVINKISLIRQDLARSSIQALVVSALDEVAWLLNLRGSDIVYNPVFFGYILLTQEKTILFAHLSQLNDEILLFLKSNHIIVESYSSLFTSLSSFAQHHLSSFSSSSSSIKIWMDPNYTNVRVYKSINSNHSHSQPQPQSQPQAQVQVHSQQSPIAIRKAVKNNTELEGMRQAHRRDGAAVVSFLSWLEDYFVNTEAKLDEVEAADRLEAFRRQQALFVGLSFDTISASGPNGAIIHYKPEKGTCRLLSTKEMYLLDSGAQYYDGTTDITRTIHLGTPANHEKACFTRVLKGHIGLARAVFPIGTTGPVLDVLARMPLWQNGLDYRHGTGHGVGAFLNVHEGPHGISSSARKGSVETTALQIGMTTSNEPGYYEDGKFGIRIESILIVKKANTPFSFGNIPYLDFETITLVPIQRKLLDLSLLNAEEIDWLNNYHTQCYQYVAPLLQGRALAWLQDATQQIVRV